MFIVILTSIQVRTRFEAKLVRDRSKTGTVSTEAYE